MQAVAYDWPAYFWPHQTTGCQDVISSINNGNRRIILTSPTGGGKTDIMTALIEYFSSNVQKSVLYTNRRMLFAQTDKRLTKHGIDHGLRAAGYEPRLLDDVQLCMTPSEHQAVYKKQRRELHPANLVLVDEIHCQNGDMMRQIMQDHYEQGAAIVAMTATPLDLEGEWDDLIIAGNNSQLRACGALLPAYTYCPDQPDVKLIKKYKVQDGNGKDLTDKQNNEVIMRPGVFGRVLTHWKRLNPDRKPTLLFGPDVGGSLFFAEEFRKAGVRSAHIDAKQIWWNGGFLPSDDANREAVLKATETGEIEVLCNRFVLREGIDLPHIAVGILATVFGSLKTYLQSVGRILRAAPGLTEVTLIDHGANFIRHGSPNENREWKLGQTGYKTTGIRMENMREKPESEPIICPKCGAARLSGPDCVKCGYTYRKRSRAVVQVDGTLKMVEGPSFKKHYIKREPDTEKKWIQMYHRGRSEKWDATFRECYGYFMHENHYYPPKDMPFMPTNPEDWFEKVRDVPRERLT